jgi:putative nucleotidyltransferase with HDIG domain
VFLVCAVGLIGVAHFTIGTLRPQVQVEHVLLQALFVVPVIAGALWFGLKGGLAVVAVVSAIYYMYMRATGPGRALENVDQLAMLAIYWVVAFSTGTLVQVIEKQRRAQLSAQHLARREAMIQALYSLSDALRLRDEYTRKHSERVSRLAVEIGKRRGLGDEKLERLRLAGLVHDIGKIGIHDDVLFKPAQLSPEERARVEQHPATAARILGSIEGAKEIADIVLAHHENPDGSGYPNHLAGTQIPEEAQILRVADVFSSLLDCRPYKAGFGVPAALKTMHEMGPQRLDQQSLAILEQLVAEGSPATREPRCDE